MQFPSNIEMYQAIVAFFLPAIIAIINSPGWGPRTKYWVSFAVVFAAAALHLAIAGQFSWVDLPGSVLKTLFLTIGSYLVFWKPSGIGKKIEQKIGS